MQTDVNAVLQWIYLFNSLALIHLAFRQVMKRRKGRQLDQQLKAAAVGSWMDSNPEALIRQLGKPVSRGTLDHGASAMIWQGERQLLEAHYQNEKCSGIELRQHVGDTFPNLGTYFNCAVLAALTCAWKLLAADASGEDGGAVLPVASAARQYLFNVVLMLFGAWLASFVLKRQQMLLSLACIVMVLLSLPLISWP